MYLHREKLSRIHETKYLGCFLSDDQSDDVEIYKQIRTLYTRSNKLLRMFSYCTIDVKKELFRSYCSSLYCCALWSDYRKATYRKLTVAFNNIHRRLLGLPWRCSVSAMFLKIYKKSSKFTKYIIGNIYRRPSSTLDELAQFIDKFTTVTQNLQEQHIKSYLCGDYTINLLKIDSLLHYNRFFENITTLGFFPQITRPTRLSGESNTLIDNIFTNDFCKPHL